MLILPTAYFPSIFQFSFLTQADQYLIEKEEHFKKQSYRSRCEIYGANGKLSLIVPLKRWRNHTKTELIEVSYEENWQNLHWRSIQSAYRASPYFEFYEEEIEPLVFNKQENLIERNLFIEDQLKSILGINSQAKFTESYKVSDPDWRERIHPKNKNIFSNETFPEYIQVFKEKKGFIPNLSILDLLFNLGPNSKQYLEQISIAI